MRTQAVHKLTSSLALLALLSASGCAGPIWVTEQKPQTASKIGVTASLPVGWARYSPDRDLVMTRDGFLLETIRVTRSAYGSKLDHTDRTVSKGMDEQEAAQILIDAYSADQSRHNLTVVENRPITLDDRPAFRLEITFKTPEGLTVRETICVALADDSYVVARFTAPDRHYHELHKSAFEEVLRTVEIAPLGSRKL